MSGLQRDHSSNEKWTNHEGYNDSTAGAAIQNVMRQNRPQKPATTHKSRKKLDGTTLIQVEHKGAMKEQKQAQPPKQTATDKALLKTARTLFTVCTMICRLQGFTIDSITLRDKQSGDSWSKAELEAPQPK